MQEFDSTPDHQPPSDQVRLLALPHVVLFPNIMQPLRVDTPRGCHLIDQALATDRLVAVGTYSEAEGKELGAAAEVEMYGCLSKIVAHHRSEQDEINILLSGLCRVRFLAAQFGPDGSATVQVRILADEHPGDADAQAGVLTAAVRDAVFEFMEERPGVSEYLQQLFSLELSLGPLTDIAAHLIEFDRCEKLVLLSENNVVRRAHRLLEFLEAHGAAPPPPPPWGTIIGYPPRFSDN